MTRKRVAIDIETTGLSPYSDEIVLIVYHDPDYDYPFVIEVSKSPSEFVIQQLNAIYNNYEVVAHNSSFDLVWLDVKYGVGFPQYVHDTMLAESLLTAGLADTSVSLADSVQRRLGITLDKSLQTSFEVGQELTPAQIEYATNDVKVLLPLAKAQDRLIKEKQLETVWAIEKAVTPVFCKMTRHGIRLDRSVLQPLIEEAEATAKQLREELEIILSPHVEWKRIEKEDAMRGELDTYLAALEKETHRLQTAWRNEIALVYNNPIHQLPHEWLDSNWDDEVVDKKDNKPKGQKRYVKHFLKVWRENHPRPPKPSREIGPINIGSPAQLMAAFKEVGIDVKDTSEESLRIYLPNASPDNRVILEKLLKYREASKFVSAFGENLFKYQDESGYIRPEWRQIGAATGRVACAKPNLMQMPRDDEGEEGNKFRRGFLPDESHVMIVADFSQMELRIMAELSQDTHFQQAFASGEDIHTSTAVSVFKKREVSKDERYAAKTINFGIPYGMGVSRFRQTTAQKQMYYSFPEAKKILETWKAAFPDVIRWLTARQDDAEKRGEVRTALGRIRHFSWQEEDDRVGVRLAGGNHPIQGSAADIAKLSMVLADRLLTPIGGRVVGQIHDEVIASVPIAYADYGKAVVQYAMEEAAKTVLKTVPVVVDAVVSTSWSEADAVA